MLHGGETYPDAGAQICRKIWESESIRSSHQTVSARRLEKLF